MCEIAASYRHGVLGYNAKIVASCVTTDSLEQLATNLALFRRLLDP
jgi:hypothetical protein